MGMEGGTAVPIYLGGLDGTMARVVEAFLESRHQEHFTIVDRATAKVLLVDLDQPDADQELAAATADQMIVGVGFDPTPRKGECRTYVQKPLTGALLVSALDDVVTLVGARPRADERTERVARASHARDVFTKGKPYERPVMRTRPAPSWDAPPPRKLDRAIHTRAPRIVEVANDHGTTGTAAEALGKAAEVEPIEARDWGDLRDPAVLASYRYAPATHLDGRLRQAVRQHPGQAWELKSQHLTLSSDPADASILVSGIETRLRHCCTSTLDQGWSFGVRRRPPGGDQLRRIARDTLLWNTAVWCSQGRLADTIDPFAVASIRAWPDLTRGVLTPSTLPIVALLASGPHRPADIPDQLGLPRTHVFVVLSALDNVGLLEGPGAAPMPAPTGPPRKADRGVLRRLLGRLRDA